MSRYLIVIEELRRLFRLFRPDLLVCVATGAARDSVEREMHDAIEFHLGVASRGRANPSSPFGDPIAK